MLTRRGLLKSSGALMLPASAAAANHGSGPLLKLNARIVYIGDSITALASYQNYCYLSGVIGGGRYYTPNGFQQGVSGNTSTQILARFSGALALNPAVIVIEAGTNDPTNDPTTTISNLTSMYTQAIAAGARVVATTILPGAGNVDPHITVNNFINTFPFGITVANQTPGFNNATMTGDGLHPNLLGGPIVGANVAACIQSLISSASIFTDTTGQLSPNPTMSGSIAPPAVGGNVVGTGVVPTGFRLYESGTTFTSSMVGSQDVAGNGANEQILTITNGAGGAASVVFDLPNITINGLTNDLFEAWSEVDVIQSVGLLGIAVSFASSYVFPDTTSPTIQILNGVYRTMPVPLISNQTAGTWQAILQLAASGSCQVKIHNLMCRKVPAG